MSARARQLAHDFFKRFNICGGDALTMHRAECDYVTDAITQAMREERERAALVADERCHPKVCHQDAAARIRALPDAQAKP